MSRHLWVITVVGISILGAAYVYSESKRAEPVSGEQRAGNTTESEESKRMAEKFKKTDEQWQAELTPEQYRVIRQCGTEPAFTGKYYHHDEEGVYRCIGCGAELFSSETKYESGSGWPSFWRAENDAVERKVDTSHGMTRVEITCRRCGAHLGHVFNDGPKPSGERYCVNSIALDFSKHPGKEHDTTEQKTKSTTEKK